MIALILAALLPGQPPAEPTRELHLLGWAQGMIVSPPDKNEFMVVEWNHPFVHPDFTVAAEIEERKRQVEALRGKGLRLPKGSPEREQVTQAFVDGMEALANLRRDGFKTIPANVQVKVKLEPWTRYRQEKAPVDAFDAKGNLIPINPGMLRKLREPLHWPGYQGKKSDLAEGQGVLMHMAMRKSDTKMKDEAAPPQLLVRLILSMEAPSSGSLDPLAGPR